MIGQLHMGFFWDVHETCAGSFLLISSAKGLVRLGLPTQKSDVLLENFMIRTQSILTHRENSVIAKTKRQLDDYFNSMRQVFTIVLDISGTDFQKKVWHHLQTIPYGQTQSYQEVAQHINHPNACRAVGSANHHNPIPVIIPCHRIIAKDGTLGGFANNSPECLDLKKMMLNMEKNIPNTYQTLPRQHPGLFHNH